MRLVRARRPRPPTPARGWRIAAAWACMWSASSCAARARCEVPLTIQACRRAGGRWSGTAGLCAGGPAAMRYFRWRFLAMDGATMLGGPRLQRGNVLSGGRRPGQPRRLTRAGCPVGFRPPLPDEPDGTRRLAGCMIRRAAAGAARLGHLPPSTDAVIYSTVTHLARLRGWSVNRLSAHSNRRRA